MPVSTSPWIRTVAFGLTGMMAGLAGMMYLSLLGSISSDIDTSYMLYAVAAAVIGGTSLFGGRGKALHGMLGGLVIAAVYNGIDLMGLGAEYEYMVVAVVLLHRHHGGLLCPRRSKGPFSHLLPLS